MKRLFSRAPLLGVVIPAWGVEDYLDDCVRSLLAQTHTRWEAVIVDDSVLPLVDSVRSPLNL